MKKIWMVAAATTTVFMLSAQDAAIETRGIGVIIDAHALVDVVNDEIVFDFSNDDPAEAGVAFVLGANRFSVTHLNYSLMMSNGGWWMLGSIKKPGTRPGYKRCSMLTLHQLYVHSNQVFKLF